MPDKSLFQAEQQMSPPCALWLCLASAAWIPGGTKATCPGLGWAAGPQGGAGRSPPAVGRARCLQVLQQEQPLQGMAPHCSQLIVPEHSARGHRDTVTAALASSKWDWHGQISCSSWTEASLWVTAGTVPTPGRSRRLLLAGWSCPQPDPRANTPRDGALGSTDTAHGISYHPGKPWRFTPLPAEQPSFEFQWKRVVWGLLLQALTKAWKIPKVLAFQMLQATYKVSAHG